MWRVRGRSGWILWHLVLDHPQEWCMWDDLPLEGVEWVWQVCPSVGGSLMGAGYSGWGPWWLIHHPWGTMRQMFPKKADLLKNNEFLRFLKIHSGCPKLFQQWWNLMIGWRQCLPLNILRIPKRPIYFPYDLGFNMGSVWERGSHFLGVPAIFLCFELFSWIMELITTAATLDPDLDQWQFMWFMTRGSRSDVHRFCSPLKGVKITQKYKFKLSICLGFRVNHSGFQAEPDPQAHLSSLISMYPNLQRCYHHSSNRYSHLWMAQEPHSAFNHHLNHNSAIPMHDCLTHYISGQIIATSHGSLTPYFRKT